MSTCAHTASEAKVTQLGYTIGLKKNVLRFEISDDNNDTIVTFSDRCRIHVGIRCSQSALDKPVHHSIRM